MSRQDKRRPRSQITIWKPHDYVIQLQQMSHEGWQLTEHDGINVISAEHFTDADEAQQAYISAQSRYLSVLAQFTMAPLPTKPSEVVRITPEVPYADEPTVEPWVGPAGGFASIDLENQS